MSLDAIGIVSKNPELSVKFYALLGVELRVKGGPDHYEGPTASGVRIVLDSVGLVKKLDPSWRISEMVTTLRKLTNQLYEESFWIAWPSVVKPATVRGSLATRHCTIQPILTIPVRL